MTTMSTYKRSYEDTDRKKKSILNKKKVSEFGLSRQTTNDSNSMSTNASDSSDEEGLGDDHSWKKTVGQNEDEGFVTAYALRENDVLFGRGTLLWEKRISHRGVVYFFFVTTEV